MKILKEFKKMNQTTINIRDLTQQEAIEVLNKKHVWDVREIKSMISSMKLNKPYLAVSSIKIGDIYFNHTLKHPCIVISIKKDKVYGLITTSNDNPTFVLDKTQSRYIDCYITSTCIISSIEKVLPNVISIYGNPKHLSIVKKQFKKIIKEL